MRSKRLIDGLNNSQRIRVIVNGVGFVTTVQGSFDMCFTHQRAAVGMALTTLGLSQTSPEPYQGLARTYTVYDADDQQVSVQVQVDLL